VLPDGTLPVDELPYGYGLILRPLPTKLSFLWLDICQTEKKEVKYEKI